MQHHAVGLGAEGAQDGPFLRVGMIQHRKVLGGVGGHDDAVEFLGAAGGDDGDAPGMADDLEDRRTQAHLPAQPVGDGLHIGARPPRDRQPVRLAADRQEAVIVKEPHEAGGREIQHVARGRGPDRAGNRLQEHLSEVAAQAQSVQHLAQRQPAILVSMRLAEKAQDVAQHQQMAGVQRPDLLRKQRRRGRGPVFVSPAAKAG